jgi:hypothetical protein
MGRRTSGDDGPSGSQVQATGTGEAFVSECLGPVEAGDRWWDWRRWEECGQELGDLASKDPEDWMAATSAGGSPSEPVGTLPSEEQAYKLLVARLGWRTCEGIHFTIEEFSVRPGSALLHDQVRQRRAAAHRLFVTEVVGRVPNSPLVAEEEMQLLTETAALVAGNKVGKQPQRTKRSGG